ncbi:MAG: PSD1 domain-containing protein [Verrucomicrobiales bacterium]|nr:PSD1 domain-containing protein [Verrucomicrobiales bacterium]
MNARRISSLVLLGLVASAAATGPLRAAIDASKLPPPSGAPVDFTRDIAPLLADRCYGCHGPKKQESGLRLDDAAAAKAGGEHGPLIVPGKSGESILVAVLAGAHSELAQMPKKGDKLTPEEIGKIRAWVDQGASWPATTASTAPVRKDHWAWKPPVRPAIPEVPAGTPAGLNPIDAFIRARLAQEGLKPAPPADRITLLRRVYLDLVGLPPTLEQVDAFLKDTSPDAYRNVVESLLKSPHYGERWGRHWLDAARYADSDGFEKDKARFIWAYRDWVVQAFNRDLPYDQFIIEQLAGDLLENSTQDQRVATGFLRNSMLNEEGGADPEQFRMDAMFDRMDAVGKSILGLTIQCGQCHNHKFDPVSQEEYYRMFAFLNNDHEASQVSYTPAQEMKRADLLRQIRDLEEGLRHTTPDWEQRLQQWEAEVKSDQPEWQVVPAVHEGERGERFYYYPDGSIRASSYAPTQWTAHFVATNQVAGIAAFRFEHLTDPNLPCSGPGRSIYGMAALSEFKVEATDATNPTNKVQVKFVKATADFSNPERLLEPEFQSDSRKAKGGDKRLYGPVAMAIDGKDDTAWGIDAGPGRRNVPRKAVFVAEQPLPFTHGVVLKFSLVQNHGGDNSDDNQTHNLGRFRLSVSAATNAVADPLPAQVRDILTRIPREQRTPAQVAAVFSYWRTTVPDFKETNDKIETLWRQWPEGAPTSTLVARRDQGPGDEMRKTFTLKRGDWLKPAKEVSPGVPAFLNPLPDNADDTRLTFARWLVDRKAPTTARVAVNRIWQAYFGTGLLETPEDFGLQAPAPSHPELLDWLACEFMDSGWSQKAIHRLIVNSDTYRQSSQVTAESYERDRYNRLLSRGPRFRVEGEVVRDIALSASGLLNPEMGGPSVQPPAPAFLFQPPAAYGPKAWTEAKGPERYRRGIYTFRYRSVPYPFLAAFDAPNGDFSCVRRTRSNTPLQALMTLNETLSMECAQGLAAKTLAEGGTTDDARIQYAFRRVLSRPPTADEQSELKGLLDRQRQRIADGWVNPYELATGRNELPALPKGATPTQLAAYTVVSRVLLNLDEAITKE